MRSAFLFLSIALLLASLGAAAPEARAWRHRPPSSAPAATPRSLEQTVFDLMPCLGAQRAPEALMRPTPERLALARHCLRRAGKVLDRMGPISEAQLARAVSLQVLQAPEAALRALEASRASAPRLGWLAATRAGLARDLLPAAPLARALLRADLGLLAEDSAYLPRLAYWHRSWTGAARDELGAALQRAPAVIQRSFLQRLSEDRARGGA